MQQFILYGSSRFIVGLADTLDLSDLYTYFAAHNIGLVITLEHYKARDWPSKGQPFINDPVNRVPIIWAILIPQAQDTFLISFDLHPTKCFPNRYNRSNPNSKTSLMPLIKKPPGFTLAGCPRNFVTISGRRYEVHDKTPEYCTIFGLPDDCYAPNFEDRILRTIIQYQDLQLWSFERTPFLFEKVEPAVPILYMKGEFLPSHYFMYNDTPYHFLKGIFPSKFLENLCLEPWYSTGRELLENMNLNDSSKCFRFEEEADYYIKKKLVYEFARLMLLLRNRQKYSSYIPTGPPQPNQAKQAETETRIAELLHSFKCAEEIYLSRLLRHIGKGIRQDSLNKSRFLVMDVEYVHVCYPRDAGARTFNFPCVFSTIAWLGPRDGLLVDNNLFILPCHYCDALCKCFKNHSLAYDCLTQGFAFVDRQASMIESMLFRYDGFKIYTYGRSDIFQFEQADTFFTDSFEVNTFERRNRTRARRIVDIYRDLSVPNTSLHEIEESVLKNWLPGWSRKVSKVQVNPRFTTHCDSPRWETRYREVIQSCAEDAVSAFLYLLHQKFSVNTK